MRGVRNAAHPADMKRKRKQEYESYNHRILWCAASKNLAMANTTSADSKYGALGAMLMAYLAFEGYLNWLGGRISPDVWSSEREFFSRKPYQGTMGKHLFLTTVLHLKKPNVSKRPYQTATDLGRFRNAVTHSKPDAGRRDVIIADGECPNIYESKLGKQVTKKAAQRALDDIASLVDELHGAAREFFPEIVPEQQPFDGSLATSVTGVSLR